MSKIGVMRELLLKDKYTREELAEQSGVALSTVKVQLGYHLKGEYNIHSEVINGVKKWWMTIKTDDDYKKEEREIITPEDRQDEGEEEPEPTEDDLREIKKEGLDKVPADSELEALLDE